MNVHFGTLTGGGVDAEFQVDIFNYTNADLVGPKGASGDAGTSSGPWNDVVDVTLTSAPATASEVVAMLCLDGTPSTRTAGTGSTERYWNTGKNNYLQTQTRTANTSTNVHWNNANTTGLVYAMAVEIKASGGVVNTAIWFPKARPGTNNWTTGALTVVASSLLVLIQTIEANNTGAIVANEPGNSANVSSNNSLTWTKKVYQSGLAYTNTIVMGPLANAGVDGPGYCNIAIREWFSNNVISANGYMVRVTFTPSKSGGQYLH